MQLDRQTDTGVNEHKDVHTYRATLLDNSNDNDYNFQVALLKAQKCQLMQQMLPQHGLSITLVYCIILC